jgi:hypothetical protein
LGAIQLSNLANTTDPIGEQYYLFPIPLATSNGPHTAHLKIYRRPGQNSVDPENLRLALLLDLPELGEIAIDLAVFERHLSGKILSGQQQTHQLVAVELDELREGLKGLGYQVDSLTCDLLSAEEEPGFSANDDTLSRIDIPIPQINVRA